jgi:hypothetical protein
VFLFATIVPGQAAPDEYTVNVHVTSSYFVVSDGSTRQWLNVVIDGKKLQLFDASNGYLLALGDYKAKLIKNDQKTPYESYRMYELQFPDKKTRKFLVAGQSE